MLPLAFALSLATQTALAPSPSTESARRTLFAADFASGSVLREHAVAADGLVIAWAAGEGAKFEWVLRDAANRELARATLSPPQRTARFEHRARAGERLVLVLEAADVAPHAYAVTSVRTAIEPEGSERAAEIARSALDSAQALADAEDADGAREVLKAAVVDLLALPGSEHSRANADALWSLVFPAYTLGALDAAEVGARRVADLRSAYEPDSSRARVNPMIGLANTLSAGARYDQSSAWIGAVVELYRRTRNSDDPGLAKVRLNLAIALRRLGELDRPLELVAAAMETYDCRLAPDDPERLRGVGLRAELDMALGRIDAAEAAYRDLYERARLSGDESMILDAAGNYAIALSQVGDLERARELEERNLEIAERRLPPEHIDVLRTRTNLAVTLMNLGDLPRARALLERAVAIYDAQPDISGQASVYAQLDLAELELRSGDFARARVLFEKASRTGERLADRSEGSTAWNGLAQTMAAQGELDAAIETLERLVALRLELQGPEGRGTQSARLALARCLSAAGKHARAVELCRAAVEVRDARLPADEPGRMQARLMLALCLERAGETHEARARLDAWMSDLASMRAHAAWTESPRSVEERGADLGDTLRAALAVAIASEEPRLMQRGLALLETSRAAGLWSAAAVRRLRSGANGLVASQTLDALSRELARQSSEVRPDTERIAALTAAKDRAERKLLESADDGAWTRPAPLDVAALCKSLAADEAAISFVELGSGLDTREAAPRFAAFVARRDSLRAVSLGERAAVERAVAEWRRAIGCEGATPAAPAVQRAAGEALRQLLFDPLQPALAQARSLQIVLDGALHLCPLDALPIGDRLLGESYTLRVRPTLIEWDERPPRGTADGDVVLIGGLDYGPGALGALTASADEVRAIAEMYRTRGNAVVLLDGQGVDRARFSSAIANSRIAHVATHGVLGTPGRPGLADSGFASRGVGLPDRDRAIRELSPLSMCGLALSNANRLGADGIVRGIELAALNAGDCELVVLSACDTRAGVARPGLAVASLERAMHMAGARQVLASLWPVDDASGQELMVAFHRAMVERDLPPAEALWTAKRTLRERRLPTRAWAGWVLSSASASDPR